MPSAAVPARSSASTASANEAHAGRSAGAADSANIGTTMYERPSASIPMKPYAAKTTCSAIAVARSIVGMPT